MQVLSLSREDPLEEEMAIHSSILAWKIPWTEEPGGLQSVGLPRVRHDYSNLACTHTCTLKHVFVPYSFLWLGNIPLCGYTGLEKKFVRVLNFLANPILHFINYSPVNGRLDFFCPPFGNCEWCCYEYSCTRICLSICFLSFFLFFSFFWGGVFAWG